MTEKAVSTAAVEQLHEDEGHSVAGWTSVAVMLVGVLVATIGMWIDQGPDVWSSVWVWIGIGLLVVGAILWPVLRAAGLGPKAH